jgi:serine/threonine protein kinase
VADGVAQGVTLLAGRYEVGELIGRGGMADVHVGVDSRLGRRIAIKLLKPELAKDPAFRSRFRREAQDAAKMAHPTIVRVFDAGEETILGENGAEEQIPYIVMELVEGQLLTDIIALGALDAHQAVGIIGQVLTALEYSHKAGVVHRDIKPGNIMITPSGNVKVMDFGIARAISETSTTIAHTSAIVGTARYFSPEQARGETVDARADLYSTGIVLFEMLAGDPPFVGSNPVAVAYQHVNQQAIRPSAINPAISPALDAVVMRAIAKDREERFQSAAEFRAAVTGLDSATTVIKRPAPVSDTTTALFGVNPTRPESATATIRQLTVDDQTRGSRGTQSRPPVAWIWGGVAVMAVIIVAVLYWALNLTANPFVNSNTISVPELSGQTWEDAEALLTERSLEPTKLQEGSDEIELGHVVRTEPEAGTTVAEDAEVRVYVSSGGAVRTIPSVEGDDIATATQTLTDAGYTVSSTVTEEHSASLADGVVMATSPEQGADVAQGTEVILTVSDGKIDIPSVVDEKIGTATKMLRGADYRLDVTQLTDMSCSTGLVTEQSIVGVEEQHSEITLTYCAAQPEPGETQEGESTETPEDD